MHSFTRFYVDVMFSHSADQFEYFFPRRPLLYEHRPPRRLIRLATAATAAATAAADDDDDDDDSLAVVT